MKFVTYRINENSEPGIGILYQKDPAKIYPIRQFGLPYLTMEDLIPNISDEDMAMLKKESTLDTNSYLDIERVILEAPIIHPAQDIICLGINYMAHAEESARYKKEAFGGERPYAVYFSKRVTRATGTGAVIPAYQGFVDSLDYEVELAVILSRDVKNITRSEAADYIFGYTVMNDVSARNIQTRHKQWYFGKSLDGFTPMGPCIVTADEFSFPPSLAVKSRVNGEQRQNSTTDLMIFDIPHVLAELSQGMTLKAGTIIAMGTPAGVGMGFDPPRFLKPGDVVECEIEGIGTLKNTVEIK